MRQLRAATAAPRRGAKLRPGLICSPRGSLCFPSPDRATSRKTEVCSIWGPSVQTASAHPPAALGGPRRSPSLVSACPLLSSSPGSPCTPVPASPGRLPRRPRPSQSPVRVRRGGRAVRPGRVLCQHRAFLLFSFFLSPPPSPPPPPPPSFLRQGPPTAAAPQALKAQRKGFAVSLSEPFSHCFIRRYLNLATCGNFWGKLKRGDYGGGTQGN